MGNKNSKPSTMPLPLNAQGIEDAMRDALNDTGGK